MDASVEERKVFLARYWYAASIHEIAEKSGYSESKVKSMLLRTRRKLKKALEVNPFLLDNVTGDFQAEGVEQQVKRAYSNMNPFGL